MARETFDTEEQVDLDLPVINVLAAEPLSVSRRAFAFSGLELAIATASVLIASPSDTISHVVDGVTVSAAPGTAIHVRPGQSHAFVPQTGQGWVAIIADSEPWPANSDQTVDLGRSQELVHLLFLVLTEPPDLADVFVQRIIEACATALIRLVRKQEPLDAHLNASTSYERITEDFRRAVELGFAANRTVTSYARQVGCSPRTLTRATLAAAGRTPRELIDERVGLAAARLLTMSQTPISEIASALGFTTPSNFARFFRRVMGEAPKAYRSRSLTSRDEVA